MLAKYRQLHTEFWNDGFVLDLTPEEKYFYLYLMTNPHTAQCGIYELPKRIVETQTGYNRETVDKLIQRFVEYNKIYYCDASKEIMIINWVKFNQPSSPNAIKCVNRELNNVKNKEFVNIIYKQCKKLNLKVGRIFKGIEDLVGSSVIEDNKKDIIDDKKEDDSKKSDEEKSIHSGENVTSNLQDINNIIKIFKRNIHSLTPMQRDKIISWNKEYSYRVIILAIEEAVDRGVKNMRYIEKILENWKAQGIDTPEKVKAHREEWENKKRKNKDSFNCYPQREYDFNELEKKLLGWDT